ncbi:hydantoinase/oxoprolinase [Streptomyces himastatinicus ATCC 53653]|uniref:Hydantoinase/oxoprolinase n=1 Tax=Streptomyces himastatinicus ATCC 53653 TaxID=457427 RepID=D9WJL1_9ACTN|nr:hydantoinase/oxoprolinase [Streptomyces himastatinicus ATCC 53653]
MTGRWEFWIDRGGTFTDVVGKRPDGRLVTRKLLSHHPERTMDAAVAGIRQTLGLGPDEPVPAGRIAVVKMGTTVATNALLERKGEPTVLVVTAGFRDALRIAYQNRPRLFDRRIVLPEALYDRVIEVPERVDAHGTVVRPLDLDAATEALRAAHRDGFRSAAVVLTHGYRHAAHERAVGEAARGLGFTQVSCSHEVSPLMKLVSRGDTTVVDAYLSPILRRYVEDVAAELRGIRLMFMQSNGGLREAAHFRGKDAVLSGPAGGVVGMVRSSAEAGHAKVIGFDMGGTSTDVSHYAGEFERVFGTEVAGVRMRAPMMNIHTVAAGGGSVLHFDGAPLPGGPGLGRCRPRPRLLPARRPADRHRRQCDAGPDPARPLPGGVRPARRPAAGRGHRTGALRPPRRGDRGGDRRPARRGGGRRGLPGHRRAEHGQRGQEDLRAARPRRHPLRAHQLRRRGRPARMRGRRRPRHRHGDRAAAGRSALGVRHRGRRCHRHARAGRRDGAERGVAAGRARPVRAAVRPDARRAARRRRPRGERAHHGPGPSAVRGHRRGPPRPAGRRPRDDRRLRTGAPHALRVHHGQADRHGGGVGGGGRRGGPGGRPRRGTAVQGGRPGAGGDRGDVHGGAVAAHRAVRTRRDAPRGHPHRPGGHRGGRRHHRRRPRLAGGPGRPRPSAAHPGPPPAAHVGGRHRGGPGDAGGLQQPLHGHRRTDGPAPGEHRPLRQHQGAAGLLVRPVRRRGQI